MREQSTNVFYVETARDQNGKPLGEFRLVKDGCTYAYAKARSTLCALRDLLNAPRTLEGQTVEDLDGHIGVVQCIGRDLSEVLVRHADDTLEIWDVTSGLKVVTLDQAPSTESEVSP